MSPFNLHVGIEACHIMYYPAALYSQARTCPFPQLFTGYPTAPGGKYCLLSAVNIVDDLNQSIQERMMFTPNMGAFYVVKLC